MIKIPTPQDVSNSVSNDFVDEALTEVQTRLNDPKWVRDMRYGTDQDPYYKFVVRGHASAGDKTAISDALTTAGWYRIVVTNSEDLGERPGLCGIQIYAKPDPSLTS